ncbi:hypothetical protein BP5796_10178 [Coleophoma crateriformis]|uniref:Uncharacterized protein n=1 Tax=Coleophoma crateriformis TaxID=565419 RepID=A0A3D8QUG3_9HELO|nr:hypothetical protein BP5796_10178 [Coleophoma crateriformis]
MPSIKASLEYLQDLEIYEHEKPYWVFLQPREGFDPNKQRLDNLEFEARYNIEVHDIRELDSEPVLEEFGFQVFQHQSKLSNFEKNVDVVEYRSETEALLKRTLGAVYVKCYDSRLRKNIVFERTELDLNDLLSPEGPARGVHNGKFPSYPSPIEY